MDIFLILMIRSDSKKMPDKTGYQILSEYRISKKNIQQIG